MCWNPVNCVSGFTWSNVRNCRPVDAVTVTRSPEAMLSDVVAGFVTVSQAADAYGVLIDPDSRRIVGYKGRNPQGVAS